MSKSPEAQCAKCGVKDPACRMPEGQGNAPEFCPTRTQAEIVAKAKAAYLEPGVKDFAKMASLQEAECYVGKEHKPYVMHPVKPRVQEVCEFAHKMGYRKLGVAFCAGLRSEAKVLNQILEAQGFTVVSACCKVGSTPKEFLGLRDDQKIRINEFESMCSPIAQAMILNESGTEFNVLVGLCVGHDSLFFKYALAPTTVLVAKDRVTGHNPVAALYTAGSYSARMLRPGFEPPKKD